MEGLLDGIRRIRKRSPGTLIIIVFGLYLDLPAARIALRAGARGYVHAGMRPEQLTRAVEVALKGEMVAPRQLLEYLILTTRRSSISSRTASGRSWSSSARA